MAVATLGRGEGRFRAKNLLPAILAACLFLVAIPSSSLAVPTGQIIAVPGNAAFVFPTFRVVVLKGNSAIFRNLDVMTHDVTSNQGLFSTPHIGFHQSWTMTSVAGLGVGTYPFHCSLHPAMKGKLIVKKP